MVFKIQWTGCKRAKHGFSCHCRAQRGQNDVKISWERAQSLLDYLQQENKRRPESELRRNVGNAMQGLKTKKLTDDLQKALNFLFG